MEDIFRNNIGDFSIIYLNKTLEDIDINQNEFSTLDFTSYIYKQIWDMDINKMGYGLDVSTKQMTNDLGDLKIYNENDPKKINYLEDIKIGDLVFFHTKSLDANSPTPNNCYPGHVGIYLGNKDFIHMSPTFEKIVIDKLEDDWLKLLVASRDIVKEIFKNDFK